MALALPRQPIVALRTRLAIIPGWFRAFVLAFAVYGLATWGVNTWHNTHTQLAWAILNGSFSVPPPYGTTELIPGARGERYVAYGLTPALFLMPFVAVFGKALNQTVVSAGFAAAAVAVWWELLGTMLVSRRSRVWLAALFALATPFAFYAAENGNNWSITHCVGILCTLGAVLALRLGHPVWGGVLLGLAVLSRNPILYLAPAIVLFGLAAGATTWREAWRALAGQWRALLPFAAGLALPLGYGAYYNWERFGNPFENGYALILQLDPIADFGRKPSFALEYARHHVPFYLFHPPVRFDRFPWYGPDIAGMGLLIANPILWLLPFASYRKPANLVALACILAVQTLYWLFIGDGRTQWAMRYALDYLPLALLLVASVTGRRFGKLAIGLTGLGFLMEVWGFVTWRAMGW